jgi:hypothetical protein
VFEELEKCVRTVKYLNVDVCMFESERMSERGAYLQTLYMSERRACLRSLSSVYAL